jgi:mannosyltransferase
MSTLPPPVESPVPASDDARVPGALRRLGAWLLGPGAWVVVGLLLLWSVFLRTRNLDAPFWIDEAISVGVADRPFFDIPAALQLDGNPPVYYLLLNLWIGLFGTTEAAAHTLSTAFAVATVPVGFVMARKPFGTRAALGTAAIAATLPYLTYFGQETRMYSMVAFLSVLVAGLHLRVFARGALAARIGLAVTLAVVLYTHSWGVFLVGGSVFAVALRVLLQPDRVERMRVFRIGFLIHLAAAVAWLPWIPTLLQQARETGAPWSVRPTFEMMLTGLGSLAVSQVAAAAFTVALLFGAAMVASAARGRIQVPGVPAPADAARIRDHVAVLALMLVVTLLFAWITSLINPAWASRYMGVLVGPVILLGGVLLTHSGRTGLVVLVILVGAWGISTQGDRLHNKGTAQTMATSAAPDLRAGDLVVSVQPEQLPVIAYSLRRAGAPEGLRYATAIGAQDDVRLLDWRGVLDRFRAAAPRAVLDRLLAGQAPGSRVLLVLPVTSSGNWQAPWTSLVADRTRAWRTIMQADPRLRLIGRRPVSGPGRGVFGVLFEVQR